MTCRSAKHHKAQVTNPHLASTPTAWQSHLHLVTNAIFQWQTSLARNIICQHHACATQCATAWPIRHCTRAQSSSSSATLCCSLLFSSSTCFSRCMAASGFLSHTPRSCSHTGCGASPGDTACACSTKHTHDQCVCSALCKDHAEISLELRRHEQYCLCSLQPYDIVAVFCLPACLPAYRHKRPAQACRASTVGTPWPGYNTCGEPGQLGSPVPVQSPWLRQQKALFC